MSTQNRPIFSRQEIIDFYFNNLKDFGDSSKGVGWKNELAQKVRFDQLTKVFRGKTDLSINDFGCGTGEFYNFLMHEGYSNVVYFGYDILDEMIVAANKKFESIANVKLSKIRSGDEMNVADYSVASGVFNVKHSATDQEWLSHILNTLEILNSKSTIGFSFNLLTSYSDAEFKQAYLYYADPLMVFDYCKKSFSKNVALLHDYDQYDFTVVVRKQR